MNPNLPRRKFLGTLVSAMAVPGLVEATSTAPRNHSVVRPDLPSIEAEAGGIIRSWDKLTAGLYTEGPPESVRSVVSIVDPAYLLIRPGAQLPYLFCYAIDRGVVDIYLRGDGLRLVP